MKKTKEQRVTDEYKRLDRLFVDLPEQNRKAVDGLIVQAARLRVSLDDMWVYLCENGETEPFTQSVNTKPYDRLRPIALLFGQRDKSYQSIIKQLCEKLPQEVAENVQEELDNDMEAARLCELPERVLKKNTRGQGNGIKKGAASL
jgi:hypothetical protein